MADKVTILPLGSSSPTVDIINDNFTAVYSALGGQLYKTIEDDNVMSSGIDMASFSIINCPEVEALSSVIISDTDELMLKELYDADGDGIIDSAEYLYLLDAAGNDKYYGTNALGVTSYLSVPSGVGDMLKEVYDTNNNGNVDVASSTTTADTATVSTTAVDLAGTVSGNLYYGKDNSGNVGFHALQTIPAGFIILWSGSIASIPSGWAICDGNTGTPNLLDRFIIHADHDVVGANSVGSFGDSDGSDTEGHSLTISQIPSHTHTVDFGYLEYQPLWPGNAGDFLNMSGTPASGSSNTNYTGDGDPHSHTVSGMTPKYYSLAYIMKT